jgi:signal transduction histidine kinase
MSKIFHSSTPHLIRRRRWWLLLLLVWATVVALALQSHIAEVRQQSIEVATEGARNVFRMLTLTRSWNERHGGVYVTEGDSQGTAMPKLADLTLITPAHMLRLLSEIAVADAGANFHLTSLKPLRPENVADQWERQALLAFETGVSETVGIGNIGTETFLRFMAPLKVTEPCLACHAHQGYKLGDIRGGISVSQRYEPIAKPTEASVFQAKLTYGGVFILVAAMGWLSLGLLRRRWLELAGKIQELEDTRGELVQSEKMASLGRMVAGFAHEINTPVGVAIGAVSQHEETLNHINSLLTQEEVNEDALRAELESLRHGGSLALSNLQRASKLVQSFKRTSIDQASDEVRPFGMKELITDVLFTLHNVLKRLPVQVVVECADDLRLTGTPGLLEQLLTNLVMNAVQHAFDNGQRSGTLRITARAEGELVHLEFADDGKGMEANQLARIFEPFYTTRRTEGGSGLGLYICYNIVTTQLGGSIHCNSTPDNGCSFDIRFPAHMQSASTRAEP